MMQIILTRLGAIALIAALLFGALGLFERRAEQRGYDRRDLEYQASNSAAEKAARATEAEAGRMRRRCCAAAVAQRKSSRANTTPRNIQRSTRRACAPGSTAYRWRCIAPRGRFTAASAGRLQAVCLSSPFILARP